MILERTADHANAVGEQSRSQRITGIARVGNAVEREFERLRAIDQSTPIDVSMSASIGSWRRARNFLAFESNVLSQFDFGDFMGAGVA